MAIHEFTDQDTEYLDWCTQHPEGFVVNTTRSRSIAYLKLHRTSCWTIRRLWGRGKRLTGDYAKICAASRTELEAWAAERGGTLDPCPVCGA